MHERLLLIGLLLASAPAIAAPQARDTERECRQIKQQIARVQSRMRAGYSPKTGERLAARLLELKKRRARVCR